MQKLTKEQVEQKCKEVLNFTITDKKVLEEFSNHYRLNIDGLYRYSFLNNMLIRFQGGTLAASFQNFKKIGRFVKKGEKANIMIFAPIIKEETVINETTKEETKKTALYGFMQRKVFDIKQTDGEPIKYKSNSNENLSFKYEDLKDKVINCLNIPVKEEITGKSRGYTDGKTATISECSNNVDKIKTLVHEVAHILLGHIDETILKREQHEVEAETVTYIIMNTAGINTDLEKAYISNWNQNKESIRAEKIFSVVNKIIEKVFFPRIAENNNN